MQENPFPNERKLKSRTRFEEEGSACANNKIFDMGNPECLLLHRVELPIPRPPPRRRGGARPLSHLVAKSVLPPPVTWEKAIASDQRHQQCDWSPSFNGWVGLAESGTDSRSVLGFPRSEGVAWQSSGRILGHRDYSTLGDDLPELGPLRGRVKGAHTPPSGGARATQRRAAAHPVFGGSRVGALPRPLWSRAARESRLRAPRCPTGLRYKQC